MPTHVNVSGAGWLFEQKSALELCGLAEARANEPDCQPLFMLPKLHLAANIWGMSYQPKPISTEGVDLPLALLPLTERLAENSHDLWAAQRLAQGWRFGPQRNDSQKLHPCLVPYADLPESEKEYDRIVALGTLKAILKLGYRIVPPQT